MGTASPIYIQHTHSATEHAPKRLDTLSLPPLTSRSSYSMAWPLIQQMSVAPTAHPLCLSTRPPTVLHATLPHLDARIVAPHPHGITMGPGWSEGEDSATLRGLPHEGMRVFTESMGEVGTRQ